VRRSRKLPALITSTVPQVTELLIETRATYVDGHYFSTVAAAATTADRICLHLADRYELPPKESRWLREQTFGKKLDKLRKLGLLDNASHGSLWKLNRVRNRHLHPQAPLSGLTAKRDALLAIRLLHEFVERTVSVFRDYQIEDGRLSPRPIT
jgi:hypothetical protein